MQGLHEDMLCMLPPLFAASDALNHACFFEVFNLLK